MTLWLYLLPPMAALATLFGGWLVVRFLRNQKVQAMRLLSGVAAGYLVAMTLMRVLPEALAHGGNTMAIWALGGFVLVHVLEHGLSGHFHYGEETHTHIGSTMTGFLALAGLSLHSMMDGMAIMAALRTGTGLGTLVFLGILLHRIPEGGTISSIFLAHGHGPRGAILAAATLAAAALVGALGQAWLHIPLGPVLGLTAGLGLYVACSDLLPQAQKERGWKSSLSLTAGVVAFLMTALLVPHDHGHAPSPEPPGHVHDPATPHEH